MFQLISRPAWSVRKIEALMAESMLHRLTTWTRRLAPLHREIALLILLSVIAVAIFFGTRAFASSNARLRRRDSEVWLDRGTDALARGDVTRAVQALRRSAQVDRTNEAVDVLLASALEKAGDAAAAEAVLLDRRTRTPDDPEVNVALARLEARRGRVPDSVRYYQTALDALWSGDQAGMSSRLREELIELLLAGGQRGPALSQVLVLAASSPADPASQIQLGQLFLRAGDPRRALDRFRNALGADAQNVRALAGAGEAAFALRDYPAARIYLSAAGTLDPERRRERDLATIVVTTDPLAARVSRAERARRLNQLLDLAQTALESCRSTPPDTDALRDAIDVARFPPTKAAPPEDRDRFEEGVMLANRAAKAATVCGATAGAGIDAAPLISALHALDESS
jgi:tetratricopeptide (TPR) repeat protein